MSEVLELSDQEFKIAVINMARAIMENVDNMQEFLDTVSREVDKKESKRNARDQKQCNRNKYKMANKYIRRVNIT